MAQSSVTVFGIVDATLAYGKGDLSNKSQLTNSGNSNSRLGFRGVEDLGGGMTAQFWLEAALNNDNGTGSGTNTNNQIFGAAAAAAGGQGLTFGRRSTVSLAGGWGEVRFGRDFTPQFWNISLFDPFTTNGVGGSQVLNSSITGVTALRASNSIGYFLPGDLGGVYGQFQYYLGENNSGATTSKDGNGIAVRVGFAKGPFNAAVALSRTTYAAGDVHQNNVAGQWNFGVAKLIGEYSRDRNGSVSAKGGLVGGLVPVGAGEIRVAYSFYRTDPATHPTAKKWALGYVYNLSKRTAVYATLASVRNEGTSAQALNGAITAVGGSSSGYDLGIRHVF